jgi:hypothetical protein
MGRLLGNSSGRENASARSAVTTGDLVGSSTVSSPPIAMAKVLARRGDVDEVL